jgi:hypothetical protein
MSLDWRGWLPCSPAILIAGGFDLEHLYREPDDIPTGPWGEELCSHCVYSAPRKWRKANGGFEVTKPTPRWEEALRNYAQKKGYTLQMPDGRSSPDYQPLPVLQ